MKYVFVDMDGVIAEYGYPSGLYDGDFQKGNYSGKKPVIPVIEKIIQKYSVKNEYILMVCSAVPNTKAIFEKNEWLDMFFKIPYENRIFIRNDEDKVEAIRYYIEDILRGNVQEHTIIIDDKGVVLAKAHSLGIECYHPTQLLSIVDTITEEPVDDTPKENKTENEEKNKEDVINNISEVLDGQASIDDIPTV